MRFSFVQKGGWNTMTAEAGEDGISIDVFSTTCGNSDDSAGITLPLYKAKELAEWLMEQHNAAHGRPKTLDELEAEQEKPLP